MRWRRTPSNAKTITIGAYTPPPDERETAALNYARAVTLPPIFCAGDVLAGRFRIVRFIAQGGMGEVYEAEDLELGERVALKTIRQSDGEGETALERFRREVLLARRVTHPNVCRIFDVFRHRFEPSPGLAGPREVLFLSMELLRGDTLAERLRQRGRMTVDEALPVATQMAAALDAAHQAGIVHRDFKSNNVMLIPQGDGAPRVVVTDFGLAGAHDERAQPQDESGLTMGTPAYMAPEQVEGGDVGPAADVYALGVVLFEMVTATVPFMAATAAATANLRLYNDAPSPRQRVPDLDPRWEAAILRCLERRQEQRFGTAGEAAAALQPPEGPPPKRSRARLLAEIALVAALVALVGFVLHTRRARAPLHLKTVQATTSAGLDLFPAFSPDGARLAYASDRGGTFEIYLRDLRSGGSDVALTSDGAQNVEPSWSPDGRSLAYHSKDKGGLWVVPAAGGTPQRLTEFGSRPAWSNDGQRIAFQTEALVDLAANAVAAMPPSTLWVVPAAGGAPSQVTTPGQPAGGHGAPEWSPDDRHLVFTASDRRVSSVWVVRPDGQGLLRLAIGPTYTYDPVWAADGRHVYYSAMSASGNYGLWRIGVDPQDGRARGEPAPLTEVGFGTSRHLAVSRDGRRLAFSALRMSSNLWRVDLRPGARPRPLTSETGRNARPVYSPDGRLLAFDRWQSGTNPDVWVMGKDGSGARVVVADRSIDTVPNWTPDGRALLFVSDRLGRPAVWSADAAGGNERLVTELEADSDWVRLSPDGRSLAFARRGTDGIVNVWRAELGGAARQLTFDGEFAGFPAWSPDGRALALQLRRGEDAHVAVMPSEGGEVAQITHGPGQHWPYSFSPDGRSVAYAGLHDGIWNAYRVDRDTRVQERLTRYEKLNAYVRYPAFSPRGDALVYEYAETTGNVWILEGLN